MSRSRVGPRSGNRLALVVGVSVAAGLVATAACAAWRLSKSAGLAGRSSALQAAPAEPSARLLVVGDSTAEGTGASSAATGLVGLLAADHPRLCIVNRGRDGARFADIVAQLECAQRFDAVLVLGGGNDVIRLTGDEALRSSIDAVARRARGCADKVVLMPAGNVGNAPLLFPPWSWWMTHRAQRLHEHVRAAASATGATYVNLFKPARDDPFAEQPERLNAADGLHPSDAGYALWRSELEAQSGLSAWLNRLSRERQ